MTIKQRMMQAKRRALGLALAAFVLGTLAGLSIAKALR